jgi:hypothetical protein
MPAQLDRRVDQHRVDDRRPAVVGDTMLADRREHRRRLHVPQADVDARAGRDRPGEAPAVAVEHRQGPEVDRVLGHIPLEDVRDRVQVGAAVVVDDAFRVPRRARGVIQTDGLPLVGGALPGGGGVALGEQRLVLDGADRGALADEERVIDVDEEQVAAEPGDGLAGDGREFRVDEQHLRLAVGQHERERVGVEPRVERVEHRPAHRHAEVRLDHRRRVRQERRHRVASSDAAGPQRAGQPPAASPDLAPRPPQRAVDDRHPVRIDVRRSIEERERRERPVVGLVSVEAQLVDAELFPGIHGS